MSIKETIGNLLGLIPQEVHSSQLQEIRESLQSLLSSREQQVMALQQQVLTLQNELETYKKSNKQCVELRQTIQTLTAKIQSMKNTESLQSSMNEESSVDISEEMAVNLISFIPYLDLLRAHEDLSLKDGLRLLKAKYEDVLLNCGITTAKECDGIFNALCQKVVGYQETQDKASANRVCEVVNPGYFIGDKCIQPMEGIVYNLQN